MPIILKCACGKSLRVDEKHLGKKVKCPGCGNAVLVAAPSEAAAADKPKKPVAPVNSAAAGAKPRKPAPVADDGDDDDERDEEDTPVPAKKGKSVAAEKTRKPAPVSDEDDEQDEDDTPPPPVKKGKSAAVDKARKPAPVSEDAEDESDEDEEDTPRPAKKAKPAAKGKSRMLLIVGLCLGLLFVAAAVGGGVWYFLLQPAPPPARPIATGGNKNIGPAGGAEVPVPSNEDLALIPEGSTGFVSVRPADIWKNPTVQDQLKKAPDKAKIEAFLGDMLSIFAVSPDDVERATFIIRVPDDPKMGQPDIGIVVKSSKKWDQQKLFDALKGKGLTERKTDTDGVTVHAMEGPGAFAVHFPADTLLPAADTLLVVGENEKSLRDFLKRTKTPAKSDAIAQGIQLAGAGKHPLVIAADINSKLFDKVPPDFWKQAPNLRDLKGVVATGDLNNDVALEVNLLFPDASKSEKAKKDVEGLRVLAGFALKGMGKAPPSITKLLDSLAIEQRAANVTVSGKLDVDLASLGPVLQAMGNSQRTQSIINLKQIGLSMHAFADVNKRFPKAVEAPKNSKGPGMSWRVAILPYIEQGKLYNDIHHDEPFDSPHNKQFWNKMPTVFQFPGKPNDGKTYYQVFRGDQTVFPLDLKTVVNFPSISDGTLHTILVVEAAQPVNWMAPDDIPFDAKKGGLLNQVGNHWSDNTFVAGMADASVHVFRRQIPEPTLRALITRNGGEPVNFGQWIVE